MTRYRAKKIIFNTYVVAPLVLKKYPLALRITSEHPRDELRLKNIIVVFIEV